jgi:hypothetical protein
MTTQQLNQGSRSVQITCMLFLKRSCRSQTNRAVLEGTKRPSLAAAPAAREAMLYVISEELCFLAWAPIESRGAVSVRRTALKPGKAEARGSFEKLYKDQVQSCLVLWTGPVDASGAVVLCW